MDKERTNREILPSKKSMFSGQITDSSIPKTELLSCRVSQPRMAKKHGVVRSSIWLLLLLLWAGTGCCKATCSPNSSAGSSPTQNLMVALLAPEGPPKNIRKEPLIRAAGWVVRKLNDECAVPGYNLTFVWSETSCHPGKGMVAMTQTKLIQNAKAFIGKCKVRSSRISECAIN